MADTQTQKQDALSFLDKLGERIAKRCFALQSRITEVVAPH